MKKKRILWFFLATILYSSSAQSIVDLYDKEDFIGLTKNNINYDSLTKKELYCIGYAFFQLENDKKAIELYDMAIDKGLNEDYIYLYKGLAQRYNGQKSEARDNFKIAVKMNPQSQLNYSELANSYYFKQEYDSALVIFNIARNLPYETGGPYLKIPNIYHVRGDYGMALKEYRISKSLITKNEPIYLELLKEIGLLEFTVFKNYQKSILAYKELILLTQNNYELYPKLMKAYNAAHEYVKGDSLFNILKLQFEKGSLPEGFQKYGFAPFSEFEWGTQKVVVYKYFKEPQNTLDLSYKLFLLDKNGKSVERTFMIEKTIQLVKNGANHLLCERERNGRHHTYSIGWEHDDIDLKSIKESLFSILNNVVKPSASSSYNRGKSDK